MSEKTSKSNSAMQITLLGVIVILSFATIAYAAYYRLTDYNDGLLKKYQNTQALLESKLKNQINSTDLKLDELTKTIQRISAVDKTLPNNGEVQADNKKQEIIIKHLQSQNKLISQILKHNDYLDNELGQLKRLSTTGNNDLPSSGNSIATTNPEFTPPTIDDLEKETRENKQFAAGRLKSLEAAFLESSQDSHLVKVSTDEIVKAINNYKIETQNELQTDSIDCRDAMCKIEINSIKDEGMEMLGMELTAGLADELTSFSISEFSDANQDGSVKKTFFLDFSN